MKSILFLFIMMCNALHSQTTWNSQISGTDSDLYSIFFINNLTGYCVGTGGTILKTINGGENWIPQNAGSEAKLKSVYFLNESTGFVAGGNDLQYGGTILKTTNGGFNWSENTSFLSTLNDICFSNSNFGYAVGTTGIQGSAQRIYFTSDGGNNWFEQFSNSSNNFLNSIFFVNTNVGYAVGNNGVIYKTLNSGLNWNSIFTSGAFHYSSIQFLNDSIGYISCSDGKIKKTTNYGQDWSTISVLGLSNYLFSLYFTSSNFGYSVGSNGTLIKTTDGGISWENETSTTDKDLNSIYFSDAHTGYAVGKAGIIIKTSTAGFFIKINLKILLEGMYYPLFNMLARKDTVNIYLRNNTSPYALVDSAKGIIDSLSFSNIFSFKNAPYGTYYIVVKHFNSIETWSKSGGEPLLNNNSIYTYDFTTSASKSYGNNLKLKGSKFCIYGGNVNGDAIVDGSDLSEADNDSFTGLTGRFLRSDVNGDNIVDAADVSLVDNNSYNSIIRIIP